MTKPSPIVSPVRSFNARCLRCGALCLVHARSDGTWRYVCLCGSRYTIKENHHDHHAHES